MSYLRGDNYVWTDGADQLHIWASDDADGWSESVWAVDATGQRSMERKNAGGVAIPNSVMDEYVMMRLAELIESRAIDDTIERALRHGNFGGKALVARADAIRTALRGL